MADEDPHSVVQATGKVADSIVSGLKESPALLAVVVLNVAAIAIAVWFLSNLSQNAKEMRERLLTMIERCMKAEDTLRLTPPAS